MPATISAAKIMPGGSLLVSFEVSGQPSKVASLGTPLPSIKINGGSPVELSNDTAIWCKAEAGNEIWRERWVNYDVPVSVSQGDSITLTIYSTSVVTEDGNVSAYTDFPVENLVGASIFDGSPVSGEMKIGINYWGQSYYEPLCLYSDIAKSGYDQWTNFSSENPITLNANEYGYRDWETGEIGRAHV